MSSETIEDLSVLVVDDSLPMRLFMRTMLANLEVGVVRTARDASEALQLVADRLPDLVITDHRMEPMDGVEFLRELRASGDPQVRELPVIMMTAHAGAELLRDAVKAGVDDILAKPFPQITLNERILKVLGNVSGKSGDVTDGAPEIGFQLCA